MSERPRPLPASARRRRALAVGLAVAAAVIVVLVLLQGGGGKAQRLVPRGGSPADPFAWASGREGSIEDAASQGYEHVLSAFSPGGAYETAQRVEQYRDQVKAAVGSSGLDPDTLEAMVFLESAGRPDVIAGNDPVSAAGLAQILAETASNLLGMHVDLPRSRQLTRQIARAQAAGDTARVASLEAARRSIDDRFDPAKALAGMVRYLTIAREQFGRDDLAVESYHMGIGNLEKAVRLYSGQSGGAIGDLVKQDGLSYAQLTFDSSLTRHAAANAWLSQLGDDSRSYYWRVLAAKRLLQLYRSDPKQLQALDALQRAKPSAEDALRPPRTTRTFADPGALRSALHDGTLQTLPSSPRSTGFRLSPQLAAAPAEQRALRPDALALLLYLARNVRHESGRSAPLVVTRAATDGKTEAATATGDPTNQDGTTAHTTGEAFDISRTYASGAQAQAFQYELDRLSALDVIAWVRTPRWIHVVAGPDAGKLVSLELRRA
jgi:hypothetical protein